MILVIDVGTSSVRAATVDADGRVAAVHQRACLPESPMTNFVQFDAAEMAKLVVELATAACDEAGTVPDALGIANQRASTIVWDRVSGEPVGPGVGWQDLRTVGMCMALQADGFRIAPNASATKAGFLLDMADPSRERDLCVGTVDSWVVWTLSEGHTHVTDATNAGVTALMLPDGTGWDPRICDALRIPLAALPRITGSAEVVAKASRLPGAPPIAGVAGDQQASLVGQSCLRPGEAKITFGTGGMLDVVVGQTRPGFETRGGAGCFPIIARRVGDATTWGLEAVMLTAGSNIEWLRDDVGLIGNAAESDAVAASVDGTDDVYYVPALMGLGTPIWDFGARGTLVGLTRGTNRGHVVRAVLEGVAHRGADLVEAAEADAHLRIDSLRVDGGMSANSVFVQALADATQRPVEVSPVAEATTLGAAYLAGLAIGWWTEDDLAQRWKPSRIVEPRASASQAATTRDRWREAVDRSRQWVPELTALDF